MLPTPPPPLGPPTLPRLYILLVLPRKLYKSFVILKFVIAPLLPEPEPPELFIGIFEYVLSLFM
jgi:hypothetical protein